MDLKYFIFERPRDHVAKITINRPEVRNAINTPAHKEWSDLLDQLAVDDDTWIVIITGVGDQAFCAGRDLKHLSAMQHAAPDVRKADAEIMASVTRLIERFDFPKPLISSSRASTALPSVADSRWRKHVIWSWLRTTYNSDCPRCAAVSMPGVAGCTACLARSR